MGMALGQAQSEHKKNQAYIADRERAAREAEEDRALDEQDRQASADIADLQLQEMGAEEQEGVPGAAPFGVGPETQATVDRKKVMAERLAFTRARVAKMQPENRQRFLEEEHARMRQQVNDRAFYKRGNRWVDSSLMDQATASWEGWGWGALVLPYIEQQGLSDALGVSRGTLKDQLSDTSPSPPPNG
jgi:hypothetical protein